MSSYFFPIIKLGKRKYKSLYRKKFYPYKTTNVMSVYSFPLMDKLSVFFMKNGKKSRSTTSIFRSLRLLKLLFLENGYIQWEIHVTFLTRWDIWVRRIFFDLDDRNKGARGFASFNYAASCYPYISRGIKEGMHRRLMSHSIYEKLHWGKKWLSHNSSFFYSSAYSPFYSHYKKVVPQIPTKENFLDDFVFQKSSFSHKKGSFFPYSSGSYNNSVMEEGLLSVPAWFLSPKYRQLGLNFYLTYENGKERSNLSNFLTVRIFRSRILPFQKRVVSPLIYFFSFRTLNRFFFIYLILNSFVSVFFYSGSFFQNKLSSKVKTMSSFFPPLCFSIHLSSLLNDVVTYQFIKNISPKKFSRAKLLSLRIYVGL